MLSKEFLENQLLVLTALQARLMGRPLEVDAPTSGGDAGDAGNFVASLNDMMSLASNQRQLLRDVSGALRRITVGSYGLCELSGDQIPLSRLEALPWARYTIAVQEQAEKEGGYRPQNTGLFDEAVKASAEDDGEPDAEEEEPKRRGRATKED